MQNGNTLTYPAPGGAGPATGALPRITPTRRTLDNRFPQLAFTIQTGGRSFYEVLLATDAGLFAGERAAERHAANFYPARTDDRRLQPALGGSAIFIVPQPVLHTFAGATPRPTAIYYTVVTYADSAGSEPVFAMPPDELARHAPSVGLAADFRAETLATVLGIPVGKLRRIDAALAPSRPAPAEALPRADDAVEGEDGASIAMSLATGGPQDGYERHAGAMPLTAVRDDNGGYDDGFGDWPSLGATQAVDVDESEVAGGHLGDAYAAPGLAAPFESPFPSGMPEPAALADAEDPWADADVADVDTFGGDAFAYDDGFGSLSPVDEPDGRVDAASRSHADHGRGYRDEADDFAYEAAFGLEEADDRFDPELPYEPLSLEPHALPLGQGGAAAPAPLTIDAQRFIIEQIAPFESGRDGYAAMNRDGEFRGLFGHDHSAYGRYHIGLSYGIVQFTQDSGSLGQLLTMMRARDAGRFDAVFGSDAAELLRVTTAVGPASSDVAGGRSVRVQPVGGADLWEEPWISRFATAGAHVPFQAAQNELAARLYITPIRPFARWLGLDTDRALAMVVDRAVQMGVGGARRWIAGAVGPIQTAAQRQQALAALGHSDLRSFQRTVADLDADGEWGPQSHAALVGALRALGSASPVEIPTREQMLDTLVRRSAGERWGHRVRTLRESTAFTDTGYAL